MASRCCALRCGCYGRKVAYYGCNGEEYIEDYPAVDVM